MWNKNYVSKFYSECLIIYEQLLIILFVMKDK